MVFSTLMNIQLLSSYSRIAVRCAQTGRLARNACWCIAILPLIFWFSSHPKVQGLKEKNALHALFADRGLSKKSQAGPRMGGGTTMYHLGIRRHKRNGLNYLTTSKKHCLLGLAYLKSDLLFCIAPKVKTINMCLVPCHGILALQRSTVKEETSWLQATGVVQCIQIQRVSNMSLKAFGWMSLIGTWILMLKDSDVLRSSPYLGFMHICSTFLGFIPLETPRSLALTAPSCRDVEHGGSLWRGPPHEVESWRFGREDESRALFGWLPAAWKPS